MTHGLGSDERVFIPGPDNARGFRDALGAFATGVTIVTARGPDGPVGMTANSFTSVSLDPPLVLWSVARQSSRYPVFRSAAHFAIHVLGEGQQDLALAFARSSFGFEGVDWQENDHGVPLLSGSLACFECRLHAAHEAGDHTILIGEVLRVTQGGGAPLCFSQGRFGAFTASP
ncbi:flavin reductase family protein [Rhizobium paknamense]|uniref:Flavin reductase (DIM6/NTAB) family NADH-FMN oxidoreductase RutF n=1 Tax=Rhizobium paknamense TaxID=1206817 RepID=A0ABU0IF03_9HYPH|nr:flavin reductase family protein [Rhizobium paknamense]MDQ0455841.1 flavin reductase (DIM6/NTAB) family NADH-FMN oxidoreductase RutF [Rhizobium paknamense]